MIATVFPQAANDEIHCIENDEINIWKPIGIAKVDEFEICKYLLDAPVFGVVLLFQLNYSSNIGSLNHEHLDKEFLNAA